MNRNHRRFSFLGVAVTSLCALSAITLPAHASDHGGALTEEFHQTYAITADGRIELDNINGSVHVSTWDQNQVKVDAVKYADTKERLDEAKIEVDAHSNSISIRTKYPDHDHTFNWGSHNNPAGVEYTLTVPRTVRLDEFKLINGSLDVTGVRGEVRASCINGKLEARDLAGRAELSTVNGHLDARFAQLSKEEVELSSVNGSVSLTLPSDAKAELEAQTVSGGINNDFGLHVNRHQFVGSDLSGELGGGGAHIKVQNVNGKIEIHHAQDGRTLSSPKDRSSGDDDSI
jgi:DUF4097 and DUF4098 domain-containing protein YvlB